jgi:hypothetical protein
MLPPLGFGPAPLLRPAARLLRSAARLLGRLGLPLEALLWPTIRSINTNPMLNLCGNSSWR